MAKVILDLPNELFYYTAEVQTMEKFFTVFNPPCASCIVSTMCLQENEYTKNGYKVFLIRKPCERFEKFLDDSPYYNRVILEHRMNDPKQPYGYNHRLWGYR